MSSNIAPLILEKIAVLILLIGVGWIARRTGLLKEEGEKTVSVLLVDIFWPALIFASITGSLTADDILRNLSLPLFAGITVLCGYLLGRAVVGVAGHREDRRRCFLFQSMFNNFVFMVLPFAELFLPGRGAGLLFIHNLGIILAIWTVGVPILKREGGEDFAGTLRSLIKNPGIIATLAAAATVLSGLNTRIPGFAATTFETLGTPTVAIAMMVAGSRIAGMGRRAFLPDAWNLQLALIRLVLVPALLLLVALGAWHAGLAGRETLIIFTLVNIVPAGVFSVSLANRFGSSPDLMARSVAQTHLIGTVTMIIWLIGMQRLPFFA